MKYFNYYFFLFSYVFIIFILIAWTWVEDLKLMSDIMSYNIINIIQYEEAAAVAILVKNAVFTRDSAGLNPVCHFIRLRGTFLGLGNVPP